MVLRATFQRHYVLILHVETITVYCSTGSTKSKVLAYCWFENGDFG